MTLAVRWSQRAAARLEEAALYFESVRQGSGVRFIDDVEAALGQAASHPLANPTIPGEPSVIRKAVLPRFSYWIIYEVQAKQIVVLTIWSAIREPDSWREDVSYDDQGP